MIAFIVKESLSINCVVTHRISTITCDILGSCMQDYVREMQRCLSQLDEQMDCFTYQWEARLHQLLFEAFMLAEETFKKTSGNYNVKATTLCRHLHKPTPGHVYAHFLVSHTQDKSWLHCFWSRSHCVSLGSFHLAAMVLRGVLACA